MNELRIERLTLRNFQGIQNLTLPAAGEDVDIFGDNATGKTTIANAFNWLLFGKDSHGRADFELKTLGTDGEAAHGLEHEVSATLMLGEVRVELRKIYTEKWTKKRGQTDKEFTGHETKCFIDEVPTQKGEYEKAIAYIAAEEVFRTLTDPAHFAERLPWEDRRVVLMDVCSDVTDEEVIASSPALADLPGILGDRKMEDHRKVNEAKRTKINKELSDIPVRIDEKTRGLPDVKDLDEDVLAARLAELREQRTNAEQERVRIESGGEVAEKTKQLRGVEGELLAIVNRVNADNTAALVGIRAERSDLRELLDSAKGIVGACDRDVREAAAEIERLETKMDARRTAWHALDDEKFSPVAEAETCAACGQTLPAEQVEAARAKAEAGFNATKARALTEIDAEGKQLKARHEELMESSEDRVKALEAAEELADEYEGKLAEINERAEAIESPDPADDPEYQKATADKQALKTEIAALANDNMEALTGAATKVVEFEQQIAAAEGSVARITQHADGMARIKELKRDERKLAGQYEELERELYLIEEFDKTKAAFLDEHISSYFELARFKLFKQQINGGIAPCCEVSFGGVSYRDLNHGARVNVGIDIINTLAEHHRFAPPVFVDNAEAITSIRPSTGQMIRLYVSEPDKELRVEVGDA